MDIFNLFSFLGYVDKLGVAYEAPTVATGFGAYLAQVCNVKDQRQPFLLSSQTANLVKDLKT